MFRSYTTIFRGVLKMFVAMTVMATTSTEQHLAHDQHIHAATTNNKHF